MGTKVSGAISVRKTLFASEVVFFGEISPRPIVTQKINSLLFLEGQQCLEWELGQVAFSGANSSSEIRG